MTLTGKTRTIVRALAAAAAIVAFGSIGAVYAQQQGYVGDEAEEIAALERVKLSLAAAVQAAERETGGKAISAELEVERGRAYYEIDLHTPEGLKEVHIDADTGAVLKSARDW